MDQIKPILSALVTHRFWVACGVMVPLLLGGWFTTTAKMKSDTKAGKDRIDGAFGIDSVIKGISPHPNPDSAAGLQVTASQINSEVVAAWKIQYVQQRAFLVWPEELQDDFIVQVDGYRPIEKLKFDPDDPTIEIGVQFRERYRNYIQDELPKLAEMIGADWSASSATGGEGMGAGGLGAGGLGMAGPAMGGAELGGPAGGLGGQPSFAGTPASRAAASNVTVVWDPADQTRLQNTRFDWRSMPGGKPRTLDILYAQEDLWVMQALMRIVAKTNTGATARYNAAVKEIKYIQMGREVGPTTSRVERIQSSLGVGGGEGDVSDPTLAAAGYGSEAGMDASGAPGMDASAMMGAAGIGMETPGEGSEGQSTASNDPVHNRYVDNNYVPITAERLRRVMESENPKPEDAFLVVAKRIPIRLGMVVDQRKLHHFIAACGNSNLVVEVRQVRVNRIGSSQGGMGGTDGAMGGLGGGMGGLGGGMGGLGGGMGGLGGGMGGGAGMSQPPGGGEAGMAGIGGMEAGGPGAGGAAGGTFSDVSPYDLPVEIYGMVYIYNPISLQLEEATSQVTAETDLDGGTPPAETAPVDAATPAAPDATAPAAAPEAGAAADADGTLDDPSNQPVQAGG